MIKLFPAKKSLSGATVQLKYMVSEGNSALNCSTKSALMIAIEKLVNPENSTTECRVAPSMQGKVSIVDGMAELQSLDKPTWITTCSQLAEHCMKQLLQKCSESLQSVEVS